MGAVIERARRDLEAGRTWKARDRLQGALVARGDDELLGLLGEVHFAMGDLPAAGAVWFACQRTGEEAEAADKAWRERYGNQSWELWRSLPPQVRKRRDPPVRSLKEAAARGERARLNSGSLVGKGSRRGRAADLATAAFVLAIFTCLLVGAWTILSWLIPG